MGFWVARTTVAGLGIVIHVVILRTSVNIFKAMCSDSGRIFQIGVSVLKYLS